MYIHGKFINKLHEEIEVRILTQGSFTVTKEIGAGEWGEGELFFTDDPVEIDSEVNDTFDVLLRHSASIRLYTRQYISDMFQASPLNAVVNIFRDGTCIFAGFIEPMAYSQGYNEVYDELELSCVDALGVLQHLNFRNIGSTGVDYDTVKHNATTETFYSLLTEILDGVTTIIRINNSTVLRYYYDGSKAIDNTTANRYTIFTKIGISSSLFLGDDEDDVWKQDEVMEAILKYLNLHIVQEGYKFYIFDWANVKNNSNISWKDIKSSNTTTTTKQTITMTNSMAADTNASIEIGDVYNRLELKCDVEDIDTLIENPLDKKSLEHPYGGYQRYMNEFEVEVTNGSYEKRRRKFTELVATGDVTNDNSTVTEWFVEVLKSKNWKFPLKLSNGTTFADDIVDYFIEQNLQETGLDNPTKQYEVADWVGHNLSAGIFSLGSIKRQMSKKDNSPINKLDMKEYLYLSLVNSRRHSLTDTDPESPDEGHQHYNIKGHLTDEEIENAIPMAIYTGDGLGAALSPVDSFTTHYLVISGNILLNPKGFQSDKAQNIATSSPTWTPPTSTPETIFDAQRSSVYYGGSGALGHVRFRDDKYLFRTRKYYQADSPDTPNEEITWDNTKWWGLQPYTDNDVQALKFKYSEVKDSTDQISKVAFIACMLRIGDKVVVEGTATHPGDGKVSDFHWETYKSMEECATVDEYYQQCIYIGIDPKIDDYIYGTEFEIGNNIDYTMKIDAKGMAIPITAADGVFGDVEFQILGPVNTYWDEITKRHKTFFRTEKWKTTSEPLLQASAIIIKDFQIELYSDNGKLNSVDNDDLIYVSDTDESFINKKTGLTFKIHSALTTEECAALSMHNPISKSMAMNTTSRLGVTAVYDRTQSLSRKPEQLYVDAYYNEYHQPRVLLEQRLIDSSNIAPFNHYILTAIGKTFFVQGISRNLIDGEATLKLKEINS